MPLHYSVSVLGSPAYQVFPLGCSGPMDRGCLCADEKRRSLEKEDGRGREGCGTGAGRRLEWNLEKVQGGGGGVA